MISACCSILLLTALWPYAHFLSNVRLFRWYPRTYIGIAGLLLSILAWLHYRPAMLVPLTAILVTVRAFHWLRWKRYHLPPGSLHVPNALPFTEPHFFENQARVYGPIFKISTLFQPTICVADLETGWDLLAQEGLATPPLRFDPILPGGALRYMPRKAHKHYRQLIARALTGPVLESCLPFFREAVERGVDQLRTIRPPNPRTVMRRLVEEAMVGALLGLKCDHPDFEEAKSLLGQIHVGKVERDFLPWKPQTRRNAQAAERLAELVTNSALGPMSSALPAPDRSDPVVAYNLVYVVHMACSDVTGLLTWIIDMLAREPHWLQSAQPEAIVLETLRLEQSEYLIRRTVRDLHWRGYDIPKGWLVRVCVREAHRRAPIDRPANFIPTRTDAEAYRRPFGAHNHSCPGRRMTLVLGRLLVERISMYRLRCLNLGAKEFDGWHWRPGRELRVMLEPVAK